jgi:hypothetical protein
VCLEIGDHRGQDGLVVCASVQSIRFIIRMRDEPSHSSELAAGSMPAREHSKGVTDEEADRQCEGVSRWFIADV